VSDNPTGAENQQERLITLGWVLGFVDGEGCFSIGLTRQAGGVNRKGYRTGWQVSHSFVVVQGARSLDALKRLREFFGVGALGFNRRFDNHKEDLRRYVVTDRIDLREVIIPFFMAHPLRTEKQRDFLKFAQCVDLCATGHHLTGGGLADIVEIMQTMNHQKPRTELIRILRGHTPDILAEDEEMVPSAWRHAVNGGNAAAVRSISD
jgi:LAGLIDADG DNA endonuclease family protein